MDPRRRWKAIILGATAALVLGTSVPVAAQTPDGVTESLCKLFNAKQVRTAFKQKAGSSDSQPGQCYWGITDRGKYGADLLLEMGWEPVAFEDVRLLKPGYTDLTVGGKPALFKVKPGQVLSRNGGIESRDIDSELVLDMAQGPLRLHITDGKGKDRQATLQQLGELAVAKEARLVAPPPPDATLVGLIPETIGGWPTLI